MMGCRGGQVFWGWRADTGVCPYIPSTPITYHLSPITYYLNPSSCLAVEE